jgi:hypothetical protein
MRTTLTLDDDVAAALERMRREKDVSLKELVNDTLRKGLRESGRGPRRRETFRTRVLKTGRCLLSNLDCSSRALAAAEGEDFR